MDVMKGSPPFATATRVPKRGVEKALEKTVIA
jgi:hypothetical protein